MKPYLRLVHSKALVFVACAIGISVDEGGCE